MKATPKRLWYVEAEYDGRRYLLESHFSTRKEARIYCSINPTDSQDVEFRNFRVVSYIKVA